MSGLQERVARAMIAKANERMAARIGHGPGTDLTLETMTPEGREHYLGLAAAAIEATGVERLLSAGARALERVQVVYEDSSGAADEAEAILSEVVTLDGTYVEAKPR